MEAIPPRTPSPTLKTFPNLPPPFPHADQPPYSSSSHTRRNMMSEPSFRSFSPVVDSIQTSLSYLYSDDGNHHQSYSSDVPLRFSGFAHRHHQLLCSSQPSPTCFDFHPSVHTTLRGVAANLANAVKTVRFYRMKSKIFVLVNYVSLCASIQEQTLAISRWLTLLESAIANLPDLCKKIAEGR